MTADEIIANAAIESRRIRDLVDEAANMLSAIRERCSRPEISGSTVRLSRDALLGDPRRVRAELSVAISALSEAQKLVMSTTWPTAADLEATAAFRRSNGGAGVRGGDVQGVVPP